MDDLNEFEGWNFNRKYGNMSDTDNKQKGELIKKALKIVDELAELDVDDKNEIDDIADLIEKAEKLKKDRLWKLT